jgi:phosphatidylinositol-3-phosphatase
MKTKLNMNWSDNKSIENRTDESARPQRGKLLRTTALIAVAGVLLAAQAALADDGYGYGSPSFGNHNRNQVGDIFVIALENHNFTQPGTQTSPQQILGNPAAPFINSLLTPGNPNAAQVSFATAYYNSGTGVHPSEPNYVWAEAGSDFGFHSDADPSPADGNVFYEQAIHFTGQLNGARIPWKNYQEDIELAASPTNSASGTNGPVNPYNGTTQYNYAVKHNPMAFFAVTALQNVYPLDQLFTDLNDNTVGRYNWITPDQYNEAHSSLNGGFTYMGVHYTGDQSAVAACDNFLSIVIPQIMASKAYKNNGVIVLWMDESEGGDDTNHTIPEIIISPLAKGNAYASSVPMNHSSDIKTWEEVFGLPAINNLIPGSETNNFGGYNNVATVNDLSDLFVPGAIPQPSASVTPGNIVFDSYSQHYFQSVKITNTGSTPIPGPLWLALDNLGSSVTLFNADGTTTMLAPLYSPYVYVPTGDDGTLHPNETKTVKLEFLDPGNAPINYNTRLLSVAQMP